MAATFQIWSQFLKVVNLAVEDNPDRFVFVKYRLMAAGQIDNAQPPHAQAHASLHENAFVIRTAMYDGLAHLVNRCVVHRPVRSSLDDPDRKSTRLNSSHL